MEYNGSSDVLKVPRVQKAKDAATRFRFGVFEADIRTGELTKRGLRVRLQEQPFQVLALLIERPGELVARDELQSRIWGRTVVDFDHGLNKAINKVREALGDSAENPRLIETVARPGYRFLAEVTVIESAADRQPEPASRESIPPADPGLVGVSDTRPSLNRSARRTAWTRIGLGSALVLVAAVFWIFYSQTQSSHQIRSLAVLPLQSLSGDASQDYFADGMTDALITDLGQISALRVISRTSAMTYKGAHKRLPQIARELNVDAVVEGTVLRSGNQVRITAQLIQARVDKHLWARSYEGDLRDTLAVQGEVARVIAEEVRINLTPHVEAALKTAKTVNPEAYEAYLKGRYFWNKRTADGLKAAKDYF